MFDFDFYIILLVKLNKLNNLKTRKSNFMLSIFVPRQNLVKIGCERDSFLFSLLIA